jgi:ribosomal protein L7Ae-like RNA K-turn-binding protein
VKDKIAGLLGLSRRAGHLTTGFDAVTALVIAQKAELVMLATDLSEKTEKELRFTVKDKAADTIRIPLDKAEISSALGLEKPVGVLALDDSGFATAIIKYCGHDLEEDVTI